MYATDNPMKQNPNPKMPEMGKAINNNNAVTENELIYQLEHRSSTKSIMLCEKKKEFLKALLKNKKELIEHCDLFDDITNSTLGPSIRKLLPPNDRHVDKSVNSDLAVALAKLLPLQILFKVCLKRIQEWRRLTKAQQEEEQKSFTQLPVKDKKKFWENITTLMNSKEKEAVIDAANITATSAISIQQSPLSETNLVERSLEIAMQSHSEVAKHIGMFSTEEDRSRKFDELDEERKKSSIWIKERRDDAHSLYIRLEILLGVPRCILP